MGFWKDNIGWSDVDKGRVIEIDWERREKCSHTIKREERGATAPLRTRRGGAAAPLRREREVQSHHWESRGGAATPSKERRCYRTIEKNER